MAESGDLTLAPLSNPESEKLFTQVGLDSSAHERFRSLIKKKVAQPTTMTQLRQVYPRLSQVEGRRQGHPARLQLTSVGIAIAHANLRRRGLEGFDIRIWIN